MSAAAGEASSHGSSASTRVIIIIIVIIGYVGKLALFCGEKKIVERDKPKCAGTNVHWGLTHHPALSVITVIPLSCLTSLDWFQFGPLGRRIIKNDRPHT